MSGEVVGSEVMAGEVVGREGTVRVRVGREVMARTTGLRRCSITTGLEGATAASLPVAFSC